MGLNVALARALQPKVNTKRLMSETNNVFWVSGTLDAPPKLDNSTPLVVTPLVASQKYIAPPLGPNIRSSPKLACDHNRICRVEACPTPHGPDPHEEAPHPVKGTTEAAPVFIWYAALTVPPPLALEVALLEAVIV
tara:strand:+ start:1798 stop:2205 length:408 start_codon:yes stop_codon:yes gene_type:complete